MKRKNKILLILLATIVLMFFAWIIIAPPKTNKTKINLSKNANISKLVLFIGDGMGSNHITNTEAYYEKTMCFSDFEYIGEVTTHSKTKFSPTDSAAAATALATGKKVKNGNVAYYNSKKLDTILDDAKRKGLGTGIVTTDVLSGATPAAFSAHAADRDDTIDIIESQITSNIDIMLGARIDEYLEYQTNFKRRGYDFILSLSDYNITKEKVIGLFDAVVNKEETAETPLLATLTKLAINFLEKHYPEGYVLIVEGAHIDKKSHANDIYQTMEYLNEFNNAVEYVYNAFKKDQNSAIIVTSDHETGGLLKSQKGFSDTLFTTTNHTSQNVNYFIHFNKDLDFEIPFIIDNTDIYRISIELIN